VINLIELITKLGKKYILTEDLYDYNSLILKIKTLNKRINRVMISKVITPKYHTTLAFANEISLFFKNTCLDKDYKDIYIFTYGKIIRFDSLKSEFNEFLYVINQFEQIIDNYFKEVPLIPFTKMLCPICRTKTIQKKRLTDDSVTCIKCNSNFNKEEILYILNKISPEPKISYNALMSSNGIGNIDCCNNSKIPRDLRSLGDYMIKLKDGNYCNIILTICTKCFALFIFLVNTRQLYLISNETNLKRKMIRKNIMLGYHSEKEFNRDSLYKNKIYRDVGYLIPLGRIKNVNK